MRFLIVLLGIPGVARAATLQVGPGQPFATLQGAAQAAAPGDTLEVAPGTYTEFFQLAKPLTIRGTGGSGSTTWRAPAGEDALETFGVAVTVTGFTFETDGGRAIDTDGGTLTVDDLVVRGNEADRNGAAIRVQDGAVTITGSTFEDNQTIGDGGHLAFFDTVATVSDSTLSEGAAGLGGAIYVGGGSLVVDLSTLTQNASVVGGGIYADDASVVITDSTLADNGATIYAGGWGGTDNDGGGIFLNAGSLTLDGVTLADNVAFNIGGGLQLEGGAGATIHASILDGNSASFGGGIYLASSGSLTATSSSFVGNQATAGSGGALRWRSDSGAPRVEILETLFEGNTATDYGGALGLATNNGDRGAIILTDATFAGNSAGIGGGAISILDISEVVSVRVLFCANDADDEGGAARVASSGGTVHRWTNTIFDANTTAGPGGGLYLLDGGRAAVVNNTFVGNAGGDGGAVRISNNLVDFQNNLVAFTGAGAGVSASGGGGTFNYNAWWQNTPGNVAGAALGPNDVTGDPLLAGFVANDTCDDDQLWPLAGSPLIDAGNPAIGTDADGSPPDIGAYGGPAADVLVFTDDDADGFTAAEDCDDANPDVNPDAVEVCNGVDDDCDGTIDLGAVGGSTFYVDADGDGYGTTESVDACERPDGYATRGGDCDDAASDVNPGAAEVCNDRDDDCNGAVDEDLASAWYPDGDGDGYGVDEGRVEDCARPPGHVDVGGDCDDAAPEINPGAEDPTGDDLDANCDGADGVVTPPDPNAGEALRAGCACANAGSMGGGGWFLGALAFAARRRRR